MILYKELYKYLINKKKCNCLCEKKKNHYKFYVDDKIFAVLTYGLEQDVLEVRFPPELQEKIKQNKYVIPTEHSVNSYLWKAFVISKFEFNYLKALIDLSYDITLLKMTKREKFKYEYEYEIA